ncbi:MAG: hypothetical protein HY550_00885 [Elusimicrobia bacterium]|nr:hypothetical protein [Elusimicrobiota bacterium]
MNDAELEKKFDAACASLELKDCRDLRPAVMSAIRGGQPRPSRSLWAAGFAAAAVVVVLSIPGASQSIINGIKRIFSSEYAVKIGGRPEVKGTLISADGETSEIRAGDLLLQVRVTSVDEARAKIQLTVSCEVRTAKGLERKILSKPTILTMKGKSAEIMVSDNKGEPVYRFKMVPVEKVGGYSGSLEPVKDK